MNALLLEKLLCQFRSRAKEKLNMVILSCGSFWKDGSIIQFLQDFGTRSVCSPFARGVAHLGTERISGTLWDLVRRIFSLDSWPILSIPVLSCFITKEKLIILVQLFMTPPEWDLILMYLFFNLETASYYVLFGHILGDVLLVCHFPFSAPNAGSTSPGVHLMFNEMGKSFLSAAKLVDLWKNFHDLIIGEDGLYLEEIGITKGHRVTGTLKKHVLSRK